MTHFDNKRIDRLVQLSRTHAYDPYTRFVWPEELEPDGYWCDEDLLTTHETDIHKALSEEQRFRLSKYESVNFFSLNVHGIKGALEFVTNAIYTGRYRDISERSIRKSH